MTAKPSARRQQRTASRGSASLRGQHDANANERRILDVAVREFAQKGLAGARIDEIADRAGVNKQLIYYYFKSKSGLYRAAVLRSLEEYGDFYSQGPEDESYRERMVRYIRAEDLEERVRWRRMMAWEALQSSPAKIAKNHDAYREFEDAIAELRAAQLDGEIDERFDPEMLTLAMVGIMQLPYILPQVTTMITGDAPTDDRFVDRLATFVEDLITLLAPR